MKHKTLVFNEQAKKTKLVSVRFDLSEYQSFEQFARQNNQPISRTIRVLAKLGLTNVKG
jgi:hypothetical protein